MTDGRRDVMTGVGVEARRDVDPAVGDLRLSVVVPVRDEAASVSTLVEEVAGALGGGGDWEIIFIDDGSADGTWERIAEAVAVDRRVHGLRLRRGFGKGVALAAGFDSARGRVVATLDGDLQDDPADLPRLLAAIDGGLDVAVGWRRRRADAPRRVLASRLFNHLGRVVTGVPVHDVNCGLRVFRAEVLPRLHLLGERYRLFPAVAHQLGFRVGEVETRHRPRRWGRSKYGAERGLRGLFDLMMVGFLGRFGARPGHLFGGVGVLLGGAGLLICGYLTVLRIVTGRIWPRYPLLALGVLLAGLGVQLVLTGFVAELILASRGGGAADPPVAERVGSGRRTF